MSSNSKKALFLDRDGVINFDREYVYMIGEGDFLPGIFELAKAAIKKGYIIIVVTNQAGIGRGLYSEQDFFNVTKFVEDKFVENGAKITKTFFCPYHPEFGIGKYKKDSEDRKPRPGMILKAKEEFGIDLGNSLLIGDKETDIEAAINAGIRTKILMDEKKLNPATKADYIIHELPKAIKYL